jgi:hypothetical protein
MAELVRVDLTCVQVSSTEAEYTYQLKRLIQGHQGDHAPEVKEETISNVPIRKTTGRFQKAKPGSYGELQDIGFLDSDDGFELTFLFEAYLPVTDHAQALATLSDFTGKYQIALLIDGKGKMVACVMQDAAPVLIEIGFEPTAKKWYRTRITVQSDILAVAFNSVSRYAQASLHQHRFESKIEGGAQVSQLKHLTLAARPLPDGNDLSMIDFYNGKIEGLSISTLGTQPRLLLRYDFSLNMETAKIVDVSGSGRHGQLVNSPTRAVRGHDWDGSEVDWSKAAFGYGAIHFHEDDLDDAGWDTDFVIRIPEEARSGAYAVEVRSVAKSDVFDKVTFFVRPTEKSTARVALVLSTFTYLAYANEHMWDQHRTSKLEVPSSGFEVRDDEDLRKMKRRHDLGLSLYDVHRDGSGMVYSTSKRPILNVRPGYVHWAFLRPREFSADLLMIGFLEKLGIDYDVVTDHDMHINGVEAIAKYNTVITGCHPEYHSTQTLDAWTHFAQRGGYVMYLGGNGFYWRAIPMPGSMHRLEVRRGDQGVRTFMLPGGERHHSADGSQGGLWRSRGRPANVLFGVGCCGEGLGPGVPYRRTTAASEPPYSWIFNGIPEGDLLGVNGFGGGASGDEIDSFSIENGSPLNTVVLATSTGHPDEFGIFPEEVGFPMTATLGTQTDKIRSDMIIYKTSGGGYVFSVGSINWYSSLGWDNYDNNIAKLTENVLRYSLNNT